MSTASKRKTTSHATTVERRPGQILEVHDPTEDSTIHTSVSPLGDHNDTKRRQGRPAKRWRDDQDKYWRYTIRQRTAQYIQACHHLETIMTRKDDKGDQPSGGETTRTNTGGTRSDRGQHNTCKLGGGILRPSPNHGTPRSLNGDDGYHHHHHFKICINTHSYYFQCVHESFRNYPFSYIT